MEKHTPGPWKIERPYQEPHIYIAGPKTELIACIKDHYENTKANAEFIAHACNSHYELLEMIKISLMYLQKASLEEVETVVPISHIINKIEMLIAKTEGQ